MSDYQELLIGCGMRRVKELAPVGRGHDWHGLVTCDINPDHHPDVLWDLTQLPYPFADNSFDEIHAYEVLEHTGQQGDYKFFFAQFMEFWRILKPSGYFFATVPSPSSPWVWADPSHTRLIHPLSMTFLCQTEYTAQVGNGPMTDFRNIYHGDFEVTHLVEQGLKTLIQMQAVKPSRISI
jgi:SAM-dependent methyltransferase